MAMETGLDFANSKSPNSASNTGTVMMCWAIICTASSSVIPGLSESRRPLRNTAKSEATPASSRTSAPMRSMWRWAILATSSAHSSQ